MLESTINNARPKSSAGGLTLALGRPMRALSIAYHDVYSPDAPENAARRASNYTLDRELFRSHLRSIEAATARGQVRCVERSSFGEDASPIFLTFDDGALCAYSCIAKELDALNWPGHFFVTTGWIGKPGFVNERQIRELHERGHLIGSHTCSHPERMSHMAEAELAHEWNESCQVLSRIIGQDVRVASVAGGYYSRKVARSAAAAGIEILFTSEPISRASWVDGCLVLGRYTMRESTSAALVAAIAAGAGCPRYSESSAWYGKRVVRSILGSWYVSLRKAWLDRRTSVKPDA